MTIQSKPGERKLVSEKEQMNFELAMARVKADAEEKAAEARLSAKEIASRHLARFAPFYILVVTGLLIWSAKELDGAMLAVVASLVTSVTAGFLGILSGITGTKDKDPIATVLETSLKNQAETSAAIVEYLRESSHHEESPTTVNVDGDKVSVSSGANTFTSTVPPKEK